MRRSHGLTVAALALIALSACGSAQQDTGGGEAEVATLVSAGATPSASATAAAQRPRERIDGTPEEFEALLAPYNKCLKDRGFDQLSAKRAADAQSGTRPAAGTEAAKMDEAYRYCESQFYPLPAWEKDPANPEARDFSLATVKCLKEKGIRYVEVGDDGISIALGGDDNDQPSITKGLDLIPECEREIAAKN